MATIESSIDVEVPVSTAYNQWTQFEEFPKFMEGVKSIHQIDDTHLHWVAQVGGQEKEWDARITEQLPDERIAWTSEEGEMNRGVVTFHRIEDNKTRVTLQMEYQPSGAMESIGNALGVVTRRVEGDLQRFKEFIEKQGVETGAWRGQVQR